MKRRKKLLSFALALAMIAGVTGNHLYYLKAEAADTLQATGIKGDANADGRLSVSDLVRASVALSDGSKPCSIDAMFTNNGVGLVNDDIEALSNRLLYKATNNVNVNVTGVDSNASVTVIRENDDAVVYTGTGSFGTVLPVGNYVVKAEREEAVAQTQRITLNGDAPVAVNVKTMLKLDPAIYNKPEWGKDTVGFHFIEETGIYKAEWDTCSTSVLKTPDNVKDVNEWVLEADVQIESDWNYPSAGFALYNGGNYADKVTFEIVRTTPSTDGSYENRSSVWQLRANGKDYVPNDENDTNKWLKDNQETLAGKVHLAVVHMDGEYRMFINNRYLCAVTDADVNSEISSWGTVKPGFYAEQGATFENWSYSTNVSKYARLDLATFRVGVGADWEKDTAPFVLAEDGYSYTTIDSHSSGALKSPDNVKDIEEWVFEADVEITSHESWPSVSLVLYNEDNYNQNVKFEIVHRTDAEGNLYDYLIRTYGNKVCWPNASGSSTEKWLAENVETLKGQVRLAVVHANGDYMMFINGTHLCTVTTAELSGVMNDWNTVRLGFFAEQRVTIQNWNYSTDISQYALMSATYTEGDITTQDFIYDKETGICKGSYEFFSSGILNVPGNVKDEAEWVLEADVQIVSDDRWPFVGLAMYNESNPADNIRFGIIHNTDKGTYNCGTLIKGTGVDSVTWEDGNAWIRANQKALRNKAHLAVVHFNGEYRMFINGVYLGAITGDVAANLTNGWGSVRLGFYAEQEATIENWNYSTDVSKYARLESAPYTINGGTWTANTVDFIYEGNTGIYRGAYGFFNTGMLERPINVKAVNEWVLEADVQIIADRQYPSVGFALYNGSNPEENVKFEIVRATLGEYETRSSVWQLRVNGKDYASNTEGNSTEKWVAANQETLQGKVHLAVIHVNGEYMMFINGSYLCAITGDDAANLTNGWGSVRLGFYAEQEATIENWNYSTDVSKYSIVD